MSKLVQKINYLAAYLTVLLLTVPARASTCPTRPGLANQPGVDICVQSIFDIIAGLACWATRFVTIIMVVMIVWYGFQMMRSGENSTAFTSARKSLGYAVVGMLVILGAYTIIATVANSVTAIGKGDLSYKAAKYTMFVPLDCGGY